MLTLVPRPWVIMVVYHGTSCSASDAWTFAAALSTCKGLLSPLQCIYILK